MSERSAVRVPASPASSSVSVQSKLTVGRPADVYEREADSVAKSITSGEVSAAPPPRVTPLLQRKSGKKARDAGLTDIEAELQARRGMGSSMPDGLRVAMEERFGVDFSRVRIHSDAAADRLTGSLNSLAFTQSEDIYFANGQYRPGTPEGDRLLAHELTHVVQQGGGSRGSAYIQRATIESEQETKIYHSAYVPYPLLGERGPISGKGVHEGMESRLRAANPDLVTEAPVPGGTEASYFEDTNDRWKNFTLLGRADLYMSNMPRHISGVRGVLSTASETVERSSATFEYKDRRNRGARAGGGNVSRSPRMPSGTPFRGPFPSDFYVADLKPLGIAKIGEGVRQVRNYIDGFQNFAARAHHVDRVTEAGNPAKTMGHFLGTASGQSTTGMKVPEGLDYRNIDDRKEEKRKPGDEGAFIMGKTRYWLAPLPDKGLYIYLHLNHPFPQVGTAEINAELEGLDRLRTRLKRPDPGMPKGLQVSKKERPLANRAPVEREAEEERETTVQRKETSRPKTDWKGLGREWQADRKLWSKKKAEPFLESATGRNLDRRGQIDDKLGLRRSPPVTDRDKVLKAVESIRLWSGKAGAVIGKVRFALGDKFDALAALFEKIRSRFKGAHEKAGKTAPPGRIGGWKKRLFSQIALAARQVLATFLSGLFDKMSACVNGMISGIISEFTQDISEALQAKVEELEKRVEEQKQLLEAEFEAHFGELETLLKTLREGQKIIDIVGTAVTAIRAALQLVACVSPPGLGCLWGLVGQLAVGTALDLVVGTQAFNDEVINPALKSIFGDTLDKTQKNIVAALIPEALQSYAKGTPECGISEAPAFVPRLTDGVSGDASYRKLRDDWQTTNRDELVRGIQQGARTEEGGTPSREEILEVASVLARSGLSAGELADIGDRVPRDSSGKKILDMVQILTDRQLSQAAPGATGEAGEPGGSGGSSSTITIRRRMVLPRGPRIEPGPEGPQLIVPLGESGKTRLEVGPKILPAVGPREEDRIGGGATIRF